MQFISSAKNCVDVLLWRAFKEVPNGVYVDFNPSPVAEPSVTRTFHHLGWRGFNVAKDLELLSRLQRPRDTIVCLSDKGPLSTIWCDHIDPLETLHFVHIVSDRVVDVFDNEQWYSTRPWILVVQRVSSEHGKEGLSPWEALLLRNGYQFAYTDDLYSLFVADERSELLASLQHPPNIFDNFKLGFDQQLLMTNSTSGTRIDSSSPLFSLQACAAYERANVQKAKSRLFQTQTELNDVRAELEKVRASTSWRITSPLRSLVKSAGVDLPSAIHRYTRQSLERLALGLQKYPRLRRAIQRSVNRMPGLKRKLSRATGTAVVQNGSTTEVHLGMPMTDNLDVMPLRTERIYADLQAAIENKNKD